MVELFRKSLAMPIEFETLSVNQWTQHLLCAEHYGQGRVFIAGGYWALGGQLTIGTLLAFWPLLDPLVADSAPQPLM